MKIVVSQFVFITLDLFLVYSSSAQNIMYIFISYFIYNMTMFVVFLYNVQKNHLKTSPKKGV